ncbi:hypothetical protein PFMALIP_01735 [Plasmodium falciparum MaliPS096_E11]|uniref:Uncharacterized protein n=1 Tax=Plasmodium falciparum MaliPS096_E11 TaxID=1036727 RepID=A0A024WUJ9_PLAFA|nr:hypothetical protein PFMALIP_01735 [Plasmodium falciparum MaliPS096_E11]
MVRPPRAPDYTNVKDAKELLDLIGQTVHAKVHTASKKYFDELHGDLSKATFSSEETASSIETCYLVKEYYNNHVNGGDSDKRHPCKKDGTGKEVARFSDKEGAECDNSKIHGNIKGRNGTDVGACAPYRRLSLCNRNLVKMDTNNYSKAKHDLLAEVCLAAKFEGESIKTHYPQYQAQYPGSASTTCTVLARSFADIGDIIRGRDLYGGGGRGKGKEKLEGKLKDIFAKIYNEVTSGKNRLALKDRYNDESGNYYQLREDWWTANRHTVWKAITCGTHEGDTYFRPTCSNRQGPSQANHYCRCNGDKPDDDKVNIDPPTYFDYVPQYLRWFDEY